jgi:Protein of unknown function (DUF1579)
MFQRLLTLGILLGVVVGTQVVSGQALQKPQPGPEHQRLEFFVGRWQVEGDDKFGGKVTRTSTCEWFDGRFHVICRADSTSSLRGNTKDLELLTYDSEQRAVCELQHRQLWDSTLATGKLDGKTWRWTGEAATKGKPVIDILWTETSADTYTIKVGLSTDKGAPVTFFNGKATRVK